MTLAIKENGWDGNDDTEEAAQQWSFAGALLYAVTVITTIGMTIYQLGLSTSWCFSIAYFDQRRVVNDKLGLTAMWSFNHISHVPQIVVV